MLSLSKHKIASVKPASAKYPTTGILNEMVLSKRYCLKKCKAFMPATTTIVLSALCMKEVLMNEA